MVGSGGTGQVRISVSASCLPAALTKPASSRRFFRSARTLSRAYIVECGVGRPQASVACRHVQHKRISHNLRTTIRIGKPVLHVCENWLVCKIWLDWLDWLVCKIGWVGWLQDWLGWLGWFGVQGVQGVQGLLVIFVNLAKYVTHRAGLDCSLKRRPHEQASNKKVYTCLNTVLF